MSRFLLHLFLIQKATEEAAPADQEAAAGGEAAAPEQEAPPGEEEVDIDLNDPEVGKAAETIQANFRGFQTRKKLKEEASVYYLLRCSAP